MKVSEAIQSLSDILLEAGDLEIVGIALVDGLWAIESGRQFDVVGLPLDNQDGEELVCAFLQTDVMCECERVEREPRLVLVKKENSDVTD